MDRGDGQQHRNRGTILTDVFVGQQDQRVAILDRIVDVVAERVERSFNAQGTVLNRERRVDHGGRESRLLEVEQCAQFVTQQQWRSEMHQAGSLGRLLEQRLSTPQPGIKRHDVALAD